MPRYVLLACALAASLSGCKVYDASLVQGCTPKQPPARPSGTDGASVETHFYALRDIVLDQRSDRWRTIGLDLDGICSTGERPQVECIPPSRGAVLETDGDDGIDNAFGHSLSPLIVAAQPTLPADAADNQRFGLGAVLLDIREWNGLDDDPRVTVVLSQSVLGVPGDLGDGGVPMPEVPDGGIDYDGGVPPLPRWDGNDYFFSRDDAFVDGDPARPLVYDDNAYVRGGVLVMVLPDRSNITFSGDQRGVNVKLTDAHIVGRFSADRSRLEHVVVAGRWAIDDLLDVVENIGVCRSDVQYVLLSNLLNASADVRSRPGTGGPSVPCNAISFAVEMTGYAAHNGGLRTGLPLPEGCRMPSSSDAGVDMPDAGM